MYMLELKMFAMKRTGKRMEGQATDQEKIFEKLYPEHRKMTLELYQKGFALK